VYFKSSDLVYQELRIGAVDGLGSWISFISHLNYNKESFEFANLIQSVSD
jgi:hypothetical protein